MDVDDIEDLSGQADDGTRIRRDLPAQVSRRRRNTPGGADDACGADAESSTCDTADGHVAALPGRAAVWVKTFGCSHNISDSEYMEGQLQDYGYRCAGTTRCLLHPMRRVPRRQAPPDVSSSHSRLLTPRITSLTSIDVIKFS